MPPPTTGLPRRWYLASSSWLLLAVLSWGQTIPLKRPPPDERKFVSTAVDSFIERITPAFQDPDLARLFTNCFPNTLDTTVAFHNETDTFLVTGDIDALWLRDSTNQMIPYMDFIQQDPSLDQLVCGLINRQAYSILLDPYANAFNFNNSNKGHQEDQTVPPMQPGVFEHKYEVDSLAAFLKLSYAYWSVTDKASCFGSQWLKAVESVLAVLERQQAGTDEEVEVGPAYMFQRETKVASDTLIQQGVGVPGRRCGLTKSYFRPSDDAVVLPFHIPSNAMVVVELNHLAEMVPSLYPNRLDIAMRASSMADEINEAITQYAMSRSPFDPRVQMFSYEVDGFGSKYAMDDANIPSLLSLPYLGFVSRGDPRYVATRQFVLSSSNPFFFQGTAGEGIGSPHSGPNYIWPMSIIIRALTSDLDHEIKACLQMLVESSGGTGLLRESFQKDNYFDFTREWFAWVNGLFGQLILKLIDERPHLILKSDFFKIAEV